MEEPKVSIIIGVYNCETTIKQSLGSLIEQTYQDFEVIICDDGSDDYTYEVVKKYCDKYPDQFILLRNKKNMGLNYTLNRCLANAKGQYIARMDGDDISISNRLEKQVDFLNENPDIHIVSSNMILFDAGGEWGIASYIEKPCNNDFVIGTPFAHAACMVRKEAYLAVKGYTVDSKLIRVEDYHLWVKMYEKGYKGYNIQEPLYMMRDDKDAIRRRNIKARINEAYVKYLAIRLLKLPNYYNIYIVRPIFVGMLPSKIYSHLHKKKLMKI